MWLVSLFWSINVPRNTSIESAREFCFPHVHSWVFNHSTLHPLGKSVVCVSAVCAIFVIPFFLFRLHKSVYWTEKKTTEKRKSREKQVTGRLTNASSQFQKMPITYIFSYFSLLDKINSIATTFSKLQMQKEMNAGKTSIVLLDWSRHRNQQPYVWMEVWWGFPALLVCGYVLNVAAFILRVHLTFTYWNTQETYLWNMLRYLQKFLDLTLHHK